MIKAWCGDDSLNGYVHLNRCSRTINQSNGLSRQLVPIELAPAQPLEPGSKPSPTKSCIVL